MLGILVVGQLPIGLTTRQRWVFVATLIEQHSFYYQASFHVRRFSWEAYSSQRLSQKKMPANISKGTSFSRRPFLDFRSCRRGKGLLEKRGYGNPKDGKTCWRLFPTIPDARPFGLLKRGSLRMYCCPNFPMLLNHHLNYVL
jgi:hypothetical protein